MNRILLSAMIMMVLAAACAAGTIYSDFGPGQSFNTSAGAGVDGSSFPAGYQALAASFSPISTATLDNIDIAGLYSTGAPALTVEITSDAAGSPGTILESFNLGGTVSTPTILTVTSVAHPLLSSGATYWVVLLPADPTISGEWNAAPGMSGNFDFSSNGTTWFLANNFNLAFDVNGTVAGVPDPSTASLLFVGLATLSGIIGRFHIPGKRNSD